jgi:hypothetical protein
LFNFSSTLLIIISSGFCGIIGQEFATEWFLYCAQNLA